MSNFFTESIFFVCGHEYFGIKALGISGFYSWHEIRIVRGQEPSSN